MHKLTTDTNLILAVVSLTEQGLTGAQIARQLTSNERPLRDTHVTSLWKYFGGKEKFIREIRRRIRHKVAIVSEKPAAKELLTGEELVALADYRMRRYSMQTALIKMGKPAVGAIAAQNFIAKRFGTVDKFFAEMADKVHEKRKRQ